MVIGGRQCSHASLVELNQIGISQAPFCSQISARAGAQEDSTSTNDTPPTTLWAKMKGFSVNLFTCIKNVIKKALAVIRPGNETRENSTLTPSTVSVIYFPEQKPLWFFYSVFRSQLTSSCHRGLTHSENHEEIVWQSWQISESQWKS